jgi:hypothetical protein
MKIGIIDTDTVQHAPTSKFLNKEEMQKLDAEWIYNRKSFIFKHRIPLLVERDIANAMVKKYNTVEYIDKKEDLSKVKYQKLKQLAVKRGMSYNDTFIKKEELIKAIDKLNG